MTRFSLRENPRVRAGLTTHHPGRTFPISRARARGRLPTETWGGPRVYARASVELTNKGAEMAASRQTIVDVVDALVARVGLKVARQIADDLIHIKGNASYQATVYAVKNELVTRQSR